MLATTNLLKALSNVDSLKYKNEHEDYDLGEVLNFFDNKSEGHKLRYLDGTEEIFSFEQRSDKYK